MIIEYIKYNTNYSLYNEIKRQPIPISKMKSAFIYLKNNKYKFPTDIIDIGEPSNKYFDNSKNLYDNFMFKYMYSNYIRLLEYKMFWDIREKTDDFDLLMIVIDGLYNLNQSYILNFDGRKYYDLIIPRPNKITDIGFVDTFYDTLERIYNKIYKTPEGKAYINNEKIATTTTPIPTYSEEKADIFTSSETRNIFPELTAAIQYIYLRVINIGTDCKSNKFGSVNRSFYFSEISSCRRSCN